MKNLKETLFTETLRAYNRLRLSKDRHGLPTQDHEPARTALIALYDVIEIAGLENEYQEWKQKEGEHSVVN